MYTHTIPTLLFPVKITRCCWQAMWTTLWRNSSSLRSIRALKKMAPQNFISTGTEFNWRYCISTSTPNPSWTTCSFLNNSHLNWKPVNLEGGKIDVWNKDSNCSLRPELLMKRGTSLSIRVCFQKSFFFFFLKGFRWTQQEPLDTHFPSSPFCCFSWHTNSLTHTWLGSNTGANSLTAG